MKQNQTDLPVKPTATQVATYVSIERKKQIRIEAAHAGKNLSEWISDLIDQYFENKEQLKKQ